MKPDKNTIPNVIGIIHQGDQYYLPISIENNSIFITPNDIDDLRIKIGNIVKVFSKGELLYEDNNWLFPILQKNSLNWRGPIECSVQLKQGNNIITSDKYTILVDLSTFKDEF